MAKVETREDSFLRKKIKKMLYSRRGRVSQATIFCLWASCITLLLRKFSRAQHSRFLKPNTSGFLLFFFREQVLFLTEAGKNSLFFSMRSTSVKYIYFFTQLFVKSLVKMEGRAVNRISVLARLDMEVKLATSVSKL